MTLPAGINKSFTEVASSIHTASNTIKKIEQRIQKTEPRRDLGTRRAAGLSC